MKSSIFNLDWEKFNYRDPEQRKQLIGALQCFLAMPWPFVAPEFAKSQEFIKAHKEMRKAQEFTLAGDGWTNEAAIRIAKTFHLTPAYDRGFEQIFEVDDYTGSNASGFDMAAVRSGLTFKEVKEGEKLKVYQMAGAKERVFFCYYGGALGWHRRLFEDKSWWDIDKNAREFRNKYFYNYASTYYGLLEAAADAKGCCTTPITDCSDCSADARNIAAALNYLATNIILAVKDRGYNLDPGMTRFVVLTPLQLTGRVAAALDFRQQAYQGSRKIINFNFQQISTMMLTNTNRIMVILPGETLRIGMRMDLTLFNEFDMLSYTDTVAGWARNGGCVGDIDQIACVEFAAESGSCPPASFNPQVPCGKVPGSAAEEITG